ncbi:hypothetical protein [uncultured Thiodictyon sp.]|uniref:hypothetical protein n=1 Tax=uncultured Thiodictyon sp. TaxID=1846217 RepID=UPI0025E560AD|nr:hypothetical protein [uncultured Thiodictyon sp.]
MPACTDTVVRRTRLLPILARILLLSVLLPAGGAALALPPATQQVLVEAVEAAAALDFYNARCRSDGSGRHSNDLNKLLVNKLRLTIVTVEDEMFPERNYRAVQQRLLEQSAALLADGCKAAKEGVLAEQLKDRYRKGVAAVEALP